MRVIHFPTASSLSKLVTGPVNTKERGPIVQVLKTYLQSRLAVAGAEYVSIKHA